MVQFSDFVFYPDYIGLFRAVLEIPEYVRNEPVHPDGFIGEVRTYCRYEWRDVQYLCILAVVWTLFRETLTRFVFKPVAHYAELTPANIIKMPESAWRATFYIISWSFVAYVIIGSHFELFSNPTTVFKNWYPGMDVPSDIYAAYLVQGSFYLHCMFATVFLDVWRSDSALLCVHHVLTLSLICFSYAARYHRLGSFVILFHDICDIFMELAKLCIYLKVRGKTRKYYPVWELLANIFFGIFAVLWFTCRMYWFPLKVLYSILPSTAKVHYSGHLPFGIEFNAMLWLLMLMDVYWFSLILVFLFKIMIGESGEMIDPREELDKGSLKIGLDEEEEEKRKESTTNTNGVSIPSAGRTMNGDGVKHRQPHEQNSSNQVPNQQ